MPEMLFSRYFQLKLFYMIHKTTRNIRTSLEMAHFQYKFEIPVFGKCDVCAR